MIIDREFLSLRFFSISVYVKHLIDTNNLDFSAPYGIIDIKKQITRESASYGRKRCSNKNFGII